VFICAPFCKLYRYFILPQNRSQHNPFSLIYPYPHPTTLETLQNPAPRADRHPVFPSLPPTTKKKLALRNAFRPRLGVHAAIGLPVRLVNGIVRLCRLVQFERADFAARLGFAIRDSFTEHCARPPLRHEIIPAVFTLFDDCAACEQTQQLENNQTAHIFDEIRHADVLRCDPWRERTLAVPELTNATGGDTIAKKEGDEAEIF
jgi:hypothetical protein